jgi:hypothetical protein
MIEELTKAETDLAFAGTWLRVALRKSGGVPCLVLLRIIKLVADAQNEVKALAAAVAADKASLGIAKERT